MSLTKKCPKCGKEKRLSSFYINRDFIEEDSHDVICSECAKRMSQSLGGLKKYCKQNRRNFSEMLWKNCYESIEKKYKDDSSLNDLTEKKRENFIIKKIIYRYFSMQSQTQYYKYIPKEDEENKIEESLPEDKKIFSKEWMGEYTQFQLDYLNSYYQDCLHDFKIVTRNHKDYARKIAKASLIMDINYNAMINGDSIAEKKYKEAKSIFDTLSQSAKFAENKRSTDDVAGLGSLCEVGAKLEREGFLQKKIKFEDDDIDKINKDFRWAIASIGGD